MKQSQLFTKTRKEAPADEQATNAQLLIRAGYVHKEMAGVYSFLPLGWRVFNNIAQVIREEMNRSGALEMHMSTLQEPGKWQATDRWSDEVVDNWFKTKLVNGSELGLAFTHEEDIATIMTNFVSSYQDLPFYAYHIQNKLRNEARAKSGVMRGREFYMKDSYSFSRSAEEHEAYYEQMKEVYGRIFERLGLGEQTYLTVSNGGSFSKYSYEFQTVCQAGEDVIYIDEQSGLAINADDWNDETIADFGFQTDKSLLREEKAAEVGDIYSLGTKYSEALGLMFTDEDGEKKPVVMGSYGIGVNRLLGVLTEVFADEAGLVWPEQVAPFRIHLISLNQDEASQDLYDKLTSMGIEVLFDERDLRVGEKFTDADLLGIPHRVTLSERSLSEGGLEYKHRQETESSLITEAALFDMLG